MNRYVEAPARLGECALPDGRLLGWAEWPVDGVPVLLCPGAATSRWLGFGAGVVGTLGVRLISVDRPGPGASTPALGRTFSDFAGDMRRFCSLRGLGRPRMVGNSQGAPFALACATEGVVSALAVVSGADEVARPESAGALDAGLRGLVERTVDDPRTPRSSSPGSRRRRCGTWSCPEARSATVRCTGTLASRPATAGRWTRRSPGGGAGYARDTVLAMGRWPFDLGAITVPVELWYGERDTGHSPDNGALLASRVPGARRRVVPGAGGALLWTHAEPILTSLLSLSAVTTGPSGTRTE
ncbi:alpha/beta fold hydrolase [Streptomyces bacillaris]|uniref:alpha/beta fold hydrolase n=1 Tax=Streptomyces bacillaris TaxID=68179 RepID=UPI0037F9DF33